MLAGARLGSPSPPPPLWRCPPHLGVPVGRCGRTPDTYCRLCSASPLSSWALGGHDPPVRWWSSELVVGGAAPAVCTPLPFSPETPHAAPSPEQKRVPSWVKRKPHRVGAHLGSPRCPQASGHALQPRCSCHPPPGPRHPPGTLALTGVPGEPIPDADRKRFASGLEGSHVTLSSDEGDVAGATTAPALLLHPKL